MNIWLNYKSLEKSTKIKLENNEKDLNSYLFYVRELNLKPVVNTEMFQIAIVFSAEKPMGFMVLIQMLKIKILNL